MTGFSRGDAIRVARATRQVERTLRGGAGPSGFRQTPPDDLIRFQLDEALDQGGSAAATVWRWDASANSGDGQYVQQDQSITVRDTTDSWGPATSGTFGWARVIYSQNGPVHEIWDLECDA